LIAMERNMTTRITKRLMLVLLAAGVPAAAAAVDDPHWNRATCGVCHVDAKPTAGNVLIRESDAEAQCAACHAERGGAGGCKHLSGISAHVQDISADFQANLKDGRLACSTCHDITYQCLNPSKPYSFMNPGFLRARKSPATAEYCFQCHDKSGYEKLNPHVGSVDDLSTPTCLLCHTTIPEANAAGPEIMEFNMQHDLNDACRGCHVVAAHPQSITSARPDASWDHLVVPSAKVLQAMRASEARTGMVLPLNPLNGEVFCATCHNPHESRTRDAYGSAGPGIKNRLRSNEICQACHDK